MKKLDVSVPRGVVLAPSDLVFLFEECQRCFYQKIVQGRRRPSMPMPKIFTVIDSKMKAYFDGRRTEMFAPEMPAGAVEFGERWVQSGPIWIPGHDMPVLLKGKFDTVVKFDDSGYGVVDFKTCTRNADHIPLYSRQLHSYALALEHPAPGKFGLKPVSRLGLLVFEPSEFTDVNDDFVFAGGLHWIEIERNDAAFTKFLGEVLTVLTMSTAPPPSPSCGWCKYVMSMN